MRARCGVENLRVLEFEVEGPAHQFCWTPENHKHINAWAASYQLTFSPISLRAYLVEKKIRNYERNAKQNIIYCYRYLKSDKYNQR